MFISAAFAQGVAAAPTATESMINFMVPLILIGSIMYFMVIRPQQQRAKAHQAMISAVRRGDTVVTAGGIVGKVIKVLEGDDVLVEIAEEVRVKVIKSTLLDVRSKSEATDNKAAEPDKK